MMKLVIAFVMTVVVGAFAVHAAFAQTSTVTSTPSPTGTTSVTTTLTPTVTPAVKADVTEVPAGAPKTGYGTMR